MLTDSQRQEKIDNVLLTNELIESIINKFYNEIVNKIKDDQHIKFIFRVKFNTGTIATITNLQNINKNLKDDIIQYIIERVGISTDAYINTKYTNNLYYY